MKFEFLQKFSMFANKVLYYCKKVPYFCILEKIDYDPWNE